MRKTLFFGLIVLLTACFSSTAESTPLALVFESPQASSWTNAGIVATYNAWLTAIGETPDYGEDWDGKDWQGNNWVDNKLFDIQNVPTAIFTDGVTFGNIGSDSDRRAKADNNIGSTDAIDKFGWYAHESGISTVNLSKNKADYIGFFIFDTDHGTDVTYTLKFSDGSVFNYDALGTDEDKYRFVGFVNKHPSAMISKLEIYAPDATRYGIDEVKWGRNPHDPVVPEPSSMLLLGSGLIGTALKLRKKIKN